MSLVAEEVDVGADTQLLKLDERLIDPRQVAAAAVKAILSHWLDRTPTREEVDLFMEEIAPGLEDGLPFAIGVNELRDAGLQH